LAFGWVRISSRKLGTVPPTWVPPSIGGVCAHAAAGAASAPSRGGEDRSQLHLFPSRILFVTTDAPNTRASPSERLTQTLVTAPTEPQRA
jgi:hypothetical protein